MQGFELLGVSIIFFIAYLYLPAALFRFGVEQYADLRPGPDSSPIQTFIDAAIPSAALHSATWGLMWLVGTCPLLNRFVGPPSVDWRLAASFITGEDRAYVRNAIASAPVPTIVYFISLVAVSAGIGMMFGRVVVERLSGQPLLDRAPSLPPSTWWARRVWWKAAWWRTLAVTAVALLPVRLLWFAIMEVIYATIWRVSTFLLPEQSVWLFRWSVRKPTVFVRTRGNRLYFGKFESYEKTRAGNIESVLITNVFRYCYDEVKETLADGRLPVSHFGGSLTILWDEIADIHEADESHFTALCKRYLSERERYLDHTLLQRFSGETLSDIDVYRRRIGGDKFTRTDIQSSLERLSLAGIVEAVQDGPASTFSFPHRPDAPVVTPKRLRRAEGDDTFSSAYRAYRRAIRITVRGGERSRRRTFTERRWADRRSREDTKHDA